MEKLDFKDIVSDKNGDIRNTHINIGVGEDITIKDLASLIKEIVGFKGEFHYDESKPDGTMQKLTDTSKLKKLGWEYKTSLHDGIKLMYNWYLENINKIH